VFKAVAGGIAAMLKNVGVQLDIRQAPSADFSTILTGKQFDMIYLGMTQSDPFGIAYICQIYCSTSGFIKSGVNDPENDELIRSVTTLPTPDEQYAKAAVAENTALSTFGILPTVNVPAILAVKAGLANYGAGRFFTSTPEMIGWQK
jgi:peptide/nickel transport system substrate-binding protein